MTVSGVASRYEQGLFAAMVAVAAGLDLQATLLRIVRVATDLVDAHYGALGVIGEDGDLSDFISVGLDEAHVAAIGPKPKGRGVLGMLIKHPVPIRLDDISAHGSAAGLPGGHPPMTTFLGVPIRVRGEAFGNLYLAEKRGGAQFTPADERSVLALAAAAGVAIENSRLYQEIVAHEAWLEAATHITTGVLSNADAETVLTQVCRLALQAGSCDMAALLLFDSSDRLIVEFAEGSGMTGLLGLEADSTWYAHKVTVSGVSMLLRDVSAVRVSDRDEFARLGSMLAIPLVAGDRVIGSLILAHRLGHGNFTERDIPLVEAFAAQAALSMLLESARIERERLAVFEDRDRIARDLHDLVIQRLFATGMALQGAVRLAGTSEVADRIERAVTELDATVKEIRQSIFALHEPDRGPGLRGRVQAEVDTLTEVLGFRPHLICEGAIDTLASPEAADHVLAAVREALSNAARHAHATRVDVHVVAAQGRISLTVVDDGVGLPQPPSRISGLRNLASRAAQAGGTFTAQPASGDGRGTRLVLTVPV